MRKLKVMASVFVLGLSLSAVGQRATYPNYVISKNLYAGVDIRGKQGPKIEATTWLTSVPKTKGKTVVIDFWATWCGPCRAAIPELNRWQKKFAKDVVIIGVSDEDPKLVSRFMKVIKMDYSVASDPYRRMAAATRMTALPHVIVMSPDGIVRWQGYPESAEDPLTEQLLARIVAASKRRG